LSFEAFAVTTLLTNGQYAHLDRALVLTAYSTAVVGLYTDAYASKSRPFLISVLIMLMSTMLFFLGTTPVMIIVSRAIQGASTTFTWVTGLAFLVAQVGAGDLGAYIGWTTVGVAIGEMVGPLVGGPIYDYLGHWAAFGIVEALLIVDILLRVFAKEKKREVDTETRAEQDTEARMEQDSVTDRLLQDGQANSANYNTTNGDAKERDSDRSVVRSLAWNWLGTVFILIVIFMVRGALEVVSCWTRVQFNSLFRTLMT
jgi:MFS family permease